MQRDAARHMTRSLHITNDPRIARLPAGLPGFCCDDRNCAECLREYRKGLALLGETCTQAAPLTPRKPRRSSLKRQITAAEKATGKPVTSVTLPDGTTIYFGNSAPTEAVNPWLADIAKATKQ